MSYGYKSRVTREQFEKFFKDLDKKNNGYLTEDDLAKCFKENGYDGIERTIGEMFRSADLDGDQKLTFHEFMVAMEQEVEEKMDLAESMLQRVFREFDADKDGHITCKELEEIFKEIGSSASKDQIKKVINKVDRDKNGKLDYQEFKQLITQEKLL